MGHHIVPQPSLVSIGNGEIDGIDVLLEFVDLQRSNWQAQIGFGLSQPNPKLPPGVKFLLIAPQPAHFRRGVPTIQRVLVEFVSHARRKCEKIKKIQLSTSRQADKKAPACDRG